MKHLIILILLMLSAACAWQVPGSGAPAAGVTQMHLSSEDPYNPMMTELRQRLLAAGVELTPAPLGSPYTLAITEQNRDSRVAAVGADSLASAYEVTLEVRYDILGPRSEEVALDLSSRDRKSVV